jgi:hypothetical protein
MQFVQYGMCPIHRPKQIFENNVEKCVLGMRLKGYRYLLRNQVPAKIELFPQTRLLISFRLSWNFKVLFFTQR